MIYKNLFNMNTIKREGLQAWASEGLPSKNKGPEFKPQYHQKKKKKM
jgi:hypothetical protein